MSEDAGFFAMGFLLGAGLVALWMRVGLTAVRLEMERLQRMLERAWGKR